MSFQKEKIRVVLFDWGGVFCTPAEPFAHKALQEKLSMDVDEIAAKVREFHDDYYIGKHTKETFWPLVLKKLEVEADEELNIESLNDAYLASYQPYPEMFEMVKRLKEAGIAVAMLSNMTPDMRDNIRIRHELEKYFSPDIYSCDSDVALLKPSSSIYAIALQKIGANPDEVLFIDDSQLNVDAARSLGINSLLFESREQCLRELSVFL